MPQENKPFLYEDIVLKSNEKQASLFTKISHELKTPIHGIRGIANFLEKNWDLLDNNVRRKYMNDISKATDVLNNLVETFLHLSEVNSQKISFEFQEHNLVDLVQISIDRCRTYLLQEKNLEITLNINNAIKYLAYVDSFWFKQLMINLLANAVSYSNNGIISIILDKIPNKEYYLIYVKDEGEGIPEDEIDNIFNEFTRASKETTQTKNFGLGLAICKEIVEAHGGTVWAKNNDIKGAQIGFTIPVRKINSMTQLSMPERNLILFVDDEKICHTLVDLIIPNFTNYKLINAFSGQEALSFIKRYVYNIALIISDIMLPDINGYELYNTLSQDEKYSKIPFVFQSGLTSQEEELKKHVNKNFKLLYKPYKQEDLLKAIHDAITCSKGN